ncbi:MAG TPA: cytochrome d ubiquinol oxidase subunit II [Syntrophales bacterium]|nr:cytochrome d ubiquinol oxidase subunit II [Syntrophales bacterium]
MTNDCWQPCIGYAWMLTLAVVFLTYLISDGLVSGIGILSLWIRDQHVLSDMTASFSGVWHTHQTWLVVFAGLFFGSFPAVFGRVLSVLYLPAFLFILGLVIRGVAIELLELNESRRIWTFVFALGSIILTLSQAMAVVLTLQIVFYSAFSRPPASALTAGAFTCGLTMTLIFSYVLFGAVYLIGKTSGDNQALFRIVARKVAVFLIAAAGCFIVGLSIPQPQHPVILYTAFGVTLILSLVLLRCLMRGKEKPLFFPAVGCFIALFTALLSTYPGLFPALASLPLFVSSAKSQITQLAVFCLVLPVIIIYHVFQYRVFCGKVDEEDHQNH